MKKVISTLAAVGLLAFGAGAAQAGSGSKCQPQSGQSSAVSPSQQQPGQSQSQAQSGLTQQGSSAGSQAAASSFQGTVASVDLVKGQLKACDASGRSTTFSATPNQIADFNRGDSVAFNFQPYGNSVWITQDSLGMGGTGAAAGAEAQAGGTAGAADLGPSKSLSGTISKVDKNQGSFTLKGLNFKAHPATLQNVSSGQLVSVTFQTFGTQNWASSVSQSAGGMGGSGVGEESGMGGSGSSSDQDIHGGASDQGVGGSGSEQQDSPAY